jgi:hypothetical protein
MAIQTFTIGQTLTAAQMTSLQGNDYNWTVNAQTASYVLLAADAGKHVTMTNASATTITVNTSLFTAGDFLRITNLGAGTCTITAGTATVSSAGSLALTQYASGILWFQAAGVAYFFPDAKTTASGLAYITGASFSAVASVSLPTSTFSATYSNYRVMFDVSAASVDSSVVTCRLRASGTDSSAASYSNGGTTYFIGSATIGGNNVLSATAWTFTQFNSTDNNALMIDLYNPQATQKTKIFYQNYGRVGGAQGGANGSGEFNATTSFDSLTVYPASGTITGSYKVYGYANS